METENEDKEAMKAGKKPGKICDRELNRRGLRKRRSGVSLGKGGKEAGNFTGFYRVTTGFYRIARRFYRVEPDNSMQVVDFPHIGVVRVFCEAVKWVATDGTRIKHGCRNCGLIRKAGKQETAGKINHGWTDGLRYGKDQNRKEPARTECSPYRTGRRILAAITGSNRAAKCA